MPIVRIAERSKKLSLEPIDDTLIRFSASLQDSARDAQGETLIHSIFIDGTISLPDLVIRSIEPRSVRQPHAGCAASLEPVRRLVGIRIGPGFRDKVRAVIGGTQGCTHFLTLVLDLAASHTLSVYMRIRDQFDDASAISQDDGSWMGTGLGIEPGLENACIALTSESPVILAAKRYRRGRPA